MIKAILLDDSELAINALAIKLEKFKNKIEVVATYTNPQEAMETIDGHMADVLFIDVEMPQMDGFTFLERCKTRIPYIIFITAYNHYAIQAIRNHAFDYIEKPVDIDLLSQAIDNIIIQIQNRKSTLVDNDLIHQLLHSMQQINATQQLKTIIIHSKDTTEIIMLSEIIRLESESNYTKFYLVDGRCLMTSRTMGDYEENLARNNFFRVHRSHIINLNQMRKYNRKNENVVVMKDGSIIEVSDRKRKELWERLEGL